MFQKEHYIELCRELYLPSIAQIYCVLSPSLKIRRESKHKCRSPLYHHSLARPPARLPNLKQNFVKIVYGIFLNCNCKIFSGLCVCSEDSCSCSLQFAATEEK